MKSVVDLQRTISPSSFVNDSNSLICSDAVLLIMLIMINSVFDIALCLHDMLLLQ